jgi:predicted component of type VI protein secretion system
MPCASTRVLAGALLREAAAGREPVVGPHLVRLDDPAAGRAPLREGLTIGRGAAAELRLELPEISRAHARIVAAPDGFAIADLGSKNGLAVNGAAVVSAPVPLRDGDVISIGPARLQVSGLAPTVVAPAAAAPTDTADHAEPGPQPRRLLAAAALVAAALALAAAA